MSVPLYAGLNPAQQDAVTAPDGPVLVIAGAGSGKTRTIVHRLAYLVERGVPAADLLLLTFTRKASQEMLQRAASLLNTSLHEVHGGTFHAFAYTLLRRHSPAWATGPITIMDSADSVSALKHCRDMGNIAKGDRSFPKGQTVLGLLSKARNKEADLLDILQRESMHLLPHADALVTLGEAYTHYRRTHNLVDYDDLLFECEALLAGFDVDGAPTLPPLAPQLQSRFQYLMVDEYQDTNRVQARLVRLLTGPRGNIMAVGDDAQSIYAFRGADVRNILEFPKLFPETRLIRLEENYRSTKAILDVANAVLTEAQEGYAKVLFTQKEGGDPVRVVRSMSDLTQAQVVARRVEELLETYDAKEIAVLFRAGYQSYHLEVALARKNIAFRKYGGLRYSEAVHVKDVIAFVRLCINPLDMPSLERVAALTHGIGPRTAQKIFGAVTASDNAALEKLCAKYPNLHEDFMLLNELRRAKLGPMVVLSRVVAHYEPRLQTLFPDDWPRRAQGLESLVQIAASYDDLETFVADLSLDSPEENEEEERSAIVLSTIHSAKGLEWDAVIVLDLVEDRFPSRHALARPEDFEEERRLMYVACTRAREILDLSVPSSIYNRQHGMTESAVQSPFVRALPYAAFEEWQEGYTGRVTRCERPSYGAVAAPSAIRQPVGAPIFGTKRTHNADGADNPVAVNGNTPPWEHPLTTRPARSPHQRDDHTPFNAAIENASANASPTFSDAASCGFCHHKIFGRGKIVAHLPPDKCRVNFPGVGLKVILRAFLTLEDSPA